MTRKTASRAGTRRPAARLCVALLLALLLTACVALGAAESAQPLVAATLVPPMAAAGQAQPDNAVIETAYITLSFSETYADDVCFRVVEVEEYSVVEVSGNNEEHITLYTLFLSKVDMDGMLLGSLEDEQAGRIDVYLQMAEADAEDPGYEAFCAGQESVNELMDQLRADPRFVPQA